MNAKLELVRAWLVKSQHDLGSAQKLSTYLTPYATEFRYSSGLLDPSPAEFQQALEAARGLYDFAVCVTSSSTSMMFRPLHGLGQFLADIPGW